MEFYGWIIWISHEGRHIVYRLAKYGRQSKPEKRVERRDTVQEQ